jgi:hypothetical protein
MTAPVPRRPGDMRFTKREAQRLIRSAEGEKLKNYRIEVRHDGLTLIVDNTAAPATKKSTDELDQWMVKKKKP